MARSRREYDYQPSFDATVKRAENQGSMFDNLLRDAKFFKPRQGANLIRILPPGWPKAQHYGLTVYIHGNVGPSDRRYLCLKENRSSPHKRCPICDELYNLGAGATQEEKNQLRAKPSVIYYIIDRDAEKEGPQVWTASTRTDSEIAAQSINRRTGAVIDIVNPENGYDLEFTRAGTGRTTKYRGFQVMRESSPLADSPRDEDAWLDVVFDKPLPSLLQFFPPEHIEEVFYGRARDDDKRSSREAESDKEEEDPSQLRRTRRDVDSEEPAGGRSRRLQAPEGDEEEHHGRGAEPPREERRDRGRTRRSDDRGEEEETETDRRSERRASTSNGRDRDEEEARPRRRPRADEDDEGTSRRANDEEGDDGRRARLRSRLNREEDQPRQRSRTGEDIDDEIVY